MSARPGVGTFVVGTSASPAPAELAPLRDALGLCFEQARAVGLDDEGIEALFTTTLRDSTTEEKPRTRS